MITLIDSNNLLNRVFYVHRDLVTTKGLPTGAIYGFLNVIYSLFKNRKQHEYFIVVWDSFANRKKELFPTYKGSRSEKDENLYAQRDRLKEILADLTIQQFAIQNEEADDVIGTLCYQARKLKHKVNVYSQDHDFDQMIRKNITVTFPSGKKTYVKDIDYCLEKYDGLHPSKLGEVMMLMGDAGDDVPGVPKVGIKTAVSLIKANGSIRQILKNVYTAKIINKKGEVVQITKSLAEKIDKYQDQILLNEELVVLKNDIDFDFTLKTKLTPNWKKFEEMLRDYEFSTIEKRLKYWKMYLTYDDLYSL